VTGRLLVRHLSALSLHKIGQITGALLFAVLIPRSLGPVLFGQLAFILALSLLLHMVGDLGGLDILGRFVPGWAQEGPEGRRRIGWLAWQLIWVRLGLGLLITMGLVLVGKHLAPWLDPGRAALVGLGVALRLLSWTPYHLSFALNRMDRWAVELSWRQWAMIPCLLLGRRWGLDGLLIGLLVAEAFFVGLGALWLGPYSRPHRPDGRGLWPYWRFGMGFFLANILVVLLYRGGPVLLEVLTRDTVAVGHLSLALSLYTLLIVIIGHYLTAFVPTLALLATRGQMAEARRQLQQVMHHGTVLMGALLIGIGLLSEPLAPRLFGPAFGPAGRLFFLLALALPLQPLVGAGRGAATAFGHPRMALVAMTVGLLSGLVGGLILIPTAGAVGAVLALVLGILATAVTLLLAGRAWLRPPWRSLALAILPWVLFLSQPIPSLPLALVLMVPALAAYLALLLVGRALTLTDLRRLFVLLRP